MNIYRKILFTSIFAAVMTFAVARVNAAGPFFTNGPLTIARSGHTATLLSNGKILVAGGYNGSAVAITELYDPTTGKCATNGALATARYFHTATLLPNGKVLVAGGLQSVTGGGQITVASVGTAELYDPVANTWTATGTMITARYQHTATLLSNGKVLVAGGTITNSVYTNSAEIYDPATGAWTATAPLATNRSQFTATLLTNGLVLAAGGVNQTGLVPSCELYNPTTATWSLATGSLTGSRFGHSATLLPNGHVLAAGGESTGIVATAEDFNPATGTWTSVSNMNSIRLDHTATLMPNGKVLVTGGFIIIVTAVFETNTAEIYDPNAGSWTPAGVMSAVRASHTATLLPGGQVVVMGGRSVSSTYLTTVETYEPTNATWAEILPMNAARTSHTLTLLTNGLVLAAGGQPAGLTTNSELYNPATGTWSSSGTMNVRRFEHTATLLQDGTVLVAGGNNQTNFVSSAEKYNAATGIWTPINQMAAPRGYHSASLLQNGKVLVAGGLITDTVPTNGVEVFDPASGSWLIATSMHLARQQHTGTILPNGKVLVTGGLGANNVYLNNVETYDPNTGVWTTNNPMTFARMDHTATLLPNGKVLVAGGFNQANDWLISAEIYDPAAGTWTPTGSLNFSREYHTATLLPSGQVLVAGGFSMSTLLKSAEIYDPATGTWAVTNTMTTARYQAAAALLPNGKVLVTGGHVIIGSSTNAEVFDPGLGFNSAWQPTITGIGVQTGNNVPLALIGTLFRGISEASGGNGSQDSATDYPLLQVRGLENGLLEYLPVTNWNATSATSVPLTNFPFGLAMVTAIVNGIPSQPALVNIGKVTALITFSNLTQIFDGTAKSASVTTTPPGLGVTVTYNGSTAAPTNVGSYALAAVINDTNYQGSASATFQILAPAARNFGVDVSHFQAASGIPETNWTQMFAQGIRFTFCKGSEGLTGPDDTTVSVNVSNAVQAGLLAGVYHFAHPENRPTTNGAIQEADHFLTFAGNFIGPGYLRPVLDMEETSSSLPPSAMTDWVLAFSQEIVKSRGAGATPIIYCTSDYATSQFDSRLASSALWVRTGGGDPSTGQPTSTGVFTNWAFWQYSVSSAGGISPIDLDVCHDEFAPLSSYVSPTPTLNFTFSNVTLDGGGFHLSFANVPGTHFTLVSSTNAGAALVSWIVVGAATEVAPGQFQLVDISATNSVKKFYRVRSP